MKVFRKIATRYVLDGKRVPPGTPGAKKVRNQSPRWYGNVRLCNGTRKQTPLTHDRDSSLKLLRRLQHEQDTDKAAGKAPTKPLKALVDAYERHLLGKGNTPAYVELTMGRIRRVVDALGETEWVGVSSAEISDTLAKWREEGAPGRRKGNKPKPLSVEASNHYIRAMRSLSRWLVDNEKVDADRLRGLKTLNSRPHKKHVRRPLTQDEAKRLLEAVGRGVDIEGETWTLTGPDRAWLYKLAIHTGLRASELASLTADSFDLEGGTVTVEAAYAKNRKRAVLPLHASLLTQTPSGLSAWLSLKSGKLFPGRWNIQGMAAKILRRDLKTANIPYQTEKGVCDFHALRHSFITSLARNGVHPATAQKLARHSSINLTMEVYTHLETEELRKSLEMLPGF